MTLYHASTVAVPYPEIRMSKFTKDFSWGFYCTNDYNQAVRWANRGRQTPVINYYEFEKKSDLKYLRFDEMNDEWLDFIAYCRSGKVHKYDCVEGPMADDTIWNYVNDYINGDITRDQFWALARFRYPTHQLSFHTVQAIACLEYVKSEVVYDK